MPQAGFAKPLQDRETVAEGQRLGLQPPQQSVHHSRSSARQTVVLISARDHQATALYRSLKTRGGVEQVFDPIGMNPLFGKRIPDAHRRSAQTINASASSSSGTDFSHIGDVRMD